MESKTNFFIKLITSIYDMKVFSRYAKEGILRSILYAILLTFILAVLKAGVTQYQSDNLELKFLIYQIIIYFGRILSNLLFDCLLVSIVAIIFTVFMRMVVKHIALYSLTLYAATLPLIIKTILEIINPSINFDVTFIIGTLTYVVLILKYIKDEIIRKYS